jgi:hypothetical protein
LRPRIRGEILNSLQCKKRRLMPPRPPSLSVVHAALKLSTCQPFARRGGAMRADFDIDLQAVSKGKLGPPLSG